VHTDKDPKEYGGSVIMHVVNHALDEMEVLNGH